MKTRIDRYDWPAAAASLRDRGYAHLPGLLTPTECANLSALYSEPEHFRSRIVMERFRFGRGEYQYFRYPLPPLVQQLREAFYPKLAPLANELNLTLRLDERFPATHAALLEQCHANGQTRPTPLLLRYQEGDFNCLHQDLYGDIVFPYQVVFFLKRPGIDFEGGEFLLVENLPRAQSVGRVLQPDLGDALVITTRFRAAQGQRGAYRISVRHGVSEVRRGERLTMGIPFHDAK
jgi:hypothetical protein